RMLVGVASALPLTTGRGRQRRNYNCLSKCRHALAGEWVVLLVYPLAWLPQRPRDHDVLKAGVARLDLFQIANDVIRRPAEPAAIGHAVLQCGHGRRLRLAGSYRLHLLLAVAQHAERRHELGV